MPTLKKANMATAASVTGGSRGHRHANDRSHDEMAIDRVKNGVQHDRAPAVDNDAATASISGQFRGWSKMVSSRGQSERPTWEGLFREGDRDRPLLRFVREPRKMFEERAVAKKGLAALWSLAFRAVEAAIVRIGWGSYMSVSTQKAENRYGALRRGY
jgi:hypothetical protein